MELKKLESTTKFYEEIKIYFLNPLFDLSYVDIIVTSWFFFSTVLIFIKKSSKSWTTGLVLHVFGFYHKFIINPVPMFTLMWKNTSLLFTFLIYNIKDLFLFLPKTISWVSLYRRGGYLSLLNSSRTRWQLTKSNSLFKNK